MSIDLIMPEQQHDELRQSHRVKRCGKLSCKVVPADVNDCEARGSRGAVEHIRNLTSEGVVGE